MNTFDTIPDLFHARASEWAEREFVRFEGVSASYSEVDRRSERVAGALTQRGIRKGDRVAVMLPNGHEWPVVLLALARLGAINVPANVTYGSRDLSHVLRDSGARLVICDQPTAGIVESLREDCPALEGTASVNELIDDTTAFEAQAIDPDDPMTIQYTSGTTGFPKGCVLTHRYWLEMGAVTSEHAGLGPKDVVMTAQPFYYLDPTWNFVGCMLSGAPLVVLPRFSASTFWRDVVKNGVTFIYCLGTMPVYLSKQPEDPEVDRGHKVRVAVCSGIPAERHADFETRWRCPWREAYGTTEMGAVLFVPFDDKHSVGSGAMGRPAPGYEARVAETDGTPVAVGETGELQVRGGQMMAGYWRNEEATRQWKPDGWARSGDLVYEDEHGYYHIVGRLKDMIRRAGENVAAAEVEAVLCEHPSVRAAACIAVPDEERGEEVKAFVQLQAADTPESLALESLLAFARDRLAPFKVPRYWEYIAEFPLTPSERIAKSKLRDTREDQRAGSYDARLSSWI